MTNQFESYAFQIGILEVSPLYTAERQVIVCPGHRNGSVMIYDMNAIKPNASSTPISINAHNNELACISLNINGKQSPDHNDDSPELF